MFICEVRKSQHAACVSVNGNQYVTKRQSPDCVVVTRTVVACTALWVVLIL